MMPSSSCISEEKLGEALIIEAAHKGDLEAFNQLIALYQQRVFSLSYHILGENEAAADATQDTFLQAYKAFNQFRGGSIKSWFFRIASNICYDRLRTRKRRQTSSLDQLIEEAEQSGNSSFPILEHTDSDPEKSVINKEFLRELTIGLNSLPIEQKMVVVLSDIQGMNYEEISKITGTSLGTVKSRLNRGRTKLREFLKHKELFQDDIRL